MRIESLNRLRVVVPVPEAYAARVQEGQQVTFSVPAYPGRSYFVIGVRQGKAEWVDVKPGVTVKGKTEIFGDLRAGDVVVANAMDAIRNGTSVSVQTK